MFRELRDDVYYCPVRTERSALTLVQRKHVCLSGRAGLWAPGSWAESQVAHNLRVWAIPGMHVTKWVIITGGTSSLWRTWWLSHWRSPDGVMSTTVLDMVESPMITDMSLLFILTLGNPRILHWTSVRDKKRGKLLVILQKDNDNHWFDLFWFESLINH